MCGRCFCSLEPRVLSKACSYKDASGKYQQVPWHCPNDKNDYNPSSNIGPRDHLPIMTSGKHFGNIENRVLVPMLWGMVPSNWMEDPRKHTASTHNARIETIQETMYRDPLAKGYRCIVVIEGIYEWKTTGNSKTRQPYCIYMKQDEGIKVEESSSWKEEWSETDGWKGVQVLKLAGLFRGKKNAKTGDMNYSFTIITRESNEVLSWLHHRMPVVLSNPEDEEVWLNSSIYNKNEALTRIVKLSLINGVISWHPVSTSVNNVRNKQSDLMKPVKPNLKDESENKSKSFMSMWLKGKPAKPNEKDTSETASKKRKSDANDDESSLPKKISKN